MASPRYLIGTRHYAALLLGVVGTLVCMALPPPYDGAASFGLTLVILLQIRLLASVKAGICPAWIYRSIGWMTIASLWLWLLTPLDLRSSGLPLLILLTLFELQSYVRLVHRLSTESKVTADILTGAIAGYLLLGLVASLVVALLESLQPNSFSGFDTIAGSEELTGGTRSIEQVRFIHLTYFAFVTLTTLGYGDMLPITPLAKLSSIFFSTIGPIYLAVIMGVLIGRYIQEDGNNP